MKTILAAAALAALGVSSAFAADLPARTYTKAPAMVVAPAYNWTGFYVGAELGGKTLVAGAYESPSGSYAITGDLTLFGGPDDVWVFQMASTLTVAVSARVILTGGAQARNIFWQVGSSATLAIC